MNSIAKPSQSYASATTSQYKQLGSRTNVVVLDGPISPDIELEAQGRSEYFNNPDQAERGDQDMELLQIAEAETEEPETKLQFSGFTAKWRAIATFLWFFGIGWNDATTGAILVHIELYYNISYAIVSLLWLGNAVGFVLVACASHQLNNWLGIHKSIILSAISLAAMGAIVGSGTKFPLAVIGYFIGGFGAAIGLSQFNVHLSRFENSPVLLGCAHGSYGLGATISPILSNVMINSGISWHYFYFLLLGLELFNAVNIGFSYKGIDNDVMTFNKEQQREPLKISASLKDRNTWLICFFILFYQGAEVGLAGYIVSYLLDYRKGDPHSVGYVASGFWGGLTLGRFLVTPWALKKLGARRAIITMTACSIILIILGWFIPNLIAEATLIAISGVFIGPMYPISITQLSRILPRKILVVSLTLASLFGSTGGSLFPFLIGLISNFRGAVVVLPFSIALFVSMVLSWLVLPNYDRTHIKHWWQRII